MSIRQDFEKRIAKKQQEITELELQIRDARSYLQALQDSLRLIPRDGRDQESASSGLRPGTGLAKARDLILKAGKPLHINELLTAMGKPVDKKNRLSVIGSLSSYARKNEIFVRTAPNTFGLLEMEQATDVDLPETFGKV
ncbi:MAG TPA: hypothetical protein VIH97_12465 [Candidatus Acidoferrales bacterium]